MSKSAKSDKKKKEAEFEKMIEETATDCYSDDEAFEGMVCALEDNLEFPFGAKVLGKNVKVIDIDSGNSCAKSGILVKILSEGRKYSAALSTIKLPDDKSKEGKRNSKWIGCCKWWMKQY